MLQTSETVFLVVIGIFFVVDRSFNESSCFPHDLFVFVILVPEQTSVYFPSYLIHRADPAHEDLFVKEDYAWATTIIP